MPPEGLNRVLLLGRIVAPPELDGSGDETVLRMRFATTTRRFDKEAQTVYHTTEWHTVVLGGKRAHDLSRKLSKGDQLFIEGELETRDGKTVIRPSDIKILTSGNKNGKRQRREQRF